jgi:hypothetical protein
VGLINSCLHVPALSVSSKRQARKRSRVMNTAFFPPPCASTVSAPALSTADSTKVYPVDELALLSVSVLPITASATSLPTHSLNPHVRSQGFLCLFKTFDSRLLSNSTFFIFVLWFPTRTFFSRQTSNMHAVPLRRAKHFPKPDPNPKAESSDFLDRRGLLDLPVSLPSIPVLNPLVTPLIGGPKSTPTPRDDKSKPAPPPKKDHPQPASINIPDKNSNGSGNRGDGGANIPISQNTGGGNTGTPNPNPNNPPNPNPNVSPDSNPNIPPNQNPDNPPPNQNTNIPPNPTPNTSPDQNPNAPPNPNPNTPPNPNPNDPPNSPTPTSNPDSPDSKVSDPSNSSLTNESSPSQPSGIPQDGSVHLSEPSLQNPNTGGPRDSPGGPGGSGNVVFTTISGVKTQVTLLPHPSPEDNPAGGDGNDPTSGNGNGNETGSGTDSSGGGGLGSGTIAAIVICGILISLLLLFFLRKRVKKRRAAQRTRWLSTDEKGPRTTLRSSFGDLRASTFGYRSDDGNDCGPFSDRMAAASPTPSDPFNPQMTRVTHPGIIPPAIAVHSAGRRSSRNSQFTIGSSGSDETDVSDFQWVEVRSRVGYIDKASPTDQSRLPSPISVRPFTPTESWSFPKPPNSRVTSLSINSGSRVSLVPNPFYDPVAQRFPSGFPPKPVERVVKTFDREAVDELVVEIGDEVSVLSVFDDGWGRVKVLRRNGSTEGVWGLEGLIPIDCLKSGGNKEDANFSIPGISMFDVGVGKHSPL